MYTLDYHKDHIDQRTISTSCFKRHLWVYNEQPNTTNTYPVHVQHTTNCAYIYKNCAPREENLVSKKEVFHRREK